MLYHLFSGFFSGRAQKWNLRLQLPFQLNVWHFDFLPIEHVKGVNCEKGRVEMKINEVIAGCTNRGYSDFFRCLDFGLSYFLSYSNKEINTSDNSKKPNLKDKYAITK